MALTKVLEGGIADDAVGNTKLDLSENYAFTGTVTGAGGITHLDQWRLTTSFNGNNDQVFANSERVDTTSQGYIVGGMTQSSGVFTFPVTGIWLVRASYGLYYAGDARYWTHHIFATTDNSNYTSACEGNTFIKQAESGATYVTAMQESTIDVTDTSLVKVKMTCASSQGGTGGVTCIGDTNGNRTYVTFIRFGDT